MQPGRWIIVIQRPHVLTHFTLVPPRVTLWPEQCIWFLQNVLLSLHLSSVWSQCSCKVLTHGALSYHLFWCGICIPFAHFALSLFVKWNCRLCQWWMWSRKALTCMLTCGSGMLFHLLNVMWPQSCHVTALKLCAASPWSCGLLFFLCEWVHCAIFLGANQCVLEWFPVNCQGYEPKPLISVLTQASSIGPVLGPPQWSHFL